MTQKRHKPEEIIKKLRDAVVLIPAGKGVEAVVRSIGMSKASYQRWKSLYDGKKKRMRA